MCNYLNIPSAEQDRFWMIYSKAVERALNQKKLDVSNALKKSFLGKPKYK